MTRSRTNPFVAAVAVLLLVALPAMAAPFSFTNLADTTGLGGVAFDVLSNAPSLNNSGVVVFNGSDSTRTSLSGQNIYSGIFKASAGSPVTAVFDNLNFPFSEQYATFTQNPGINNNGSVVFSGTLVGGGARLLAGPNFSGLQLATDTSSSSFNTFFNAPAINDAGRIAFGGPVVAGGTGVAAVDAAGTNLTTLVLTQSGFYSAISGPPTINNADRVVFRGIVAAGQGGGVRIVTLDSGGGAETVLTNTNGAPFAAISSVFVPVDDAGRAGIFGSLDGGGSALGVLAADGSGTLTTVASTSTGWTSFAAVALSDNGTLAFSGNTLVESGIFIGGNPTNDFVIRVGDPLFGSTVSSLTLSREGVNDSGQVAFRYALTDGRAGIAIATPIPEPTTVLLLIVAVAVAGLTLRRVRRAALAHSA